MFIPTPLLADMVVLKICLSLVKILGGKSVSASKVVCSSQTRVLKERYSELNHKTVVTYRIIYYLNFAILISFMQNYTPYLQSSVAIDNNINVT